MENDGGRRKSGQAEFIVILGVLVVVAVAALYAFRGADILRSPVPEGVYDEQRQVAGSITGMIRDATDETLKGMMSHGGYLGDESLGFGTYHDVDTVKLLNVDVPFWQRCSTEMVPEMDDIEDWMAASIERMVRDGLDDIESIYGNRAEFTRPGLDVKVDVRGDVPLEPDMVVVTVSLPTKVRNYTMSSDLYPYVVEAETKFGRMYSFAKSFAEASADNRYFDVYTIGAIYFSKIMGDGYPKLPAIEALTECGEVVYRGPGEIDEYLLEIAEYVMLSTEWWKAMRPASSEPKVFAIQDLNGEVYDDLEPRTRLVDDFGFGLHDHVLMTNFDMPTHKGYVIPVCVSTHNHPYEFDYPFVVRTRDPYTGYYFNFASMVSVREGTEPVNGGVPLMVPGDCSGAGVTAPECDESLLGCSGRVRVVNDVGEALEGASVVYGGCLVGEGETDEDGLVGGAVKCGSRELSAFHTDEYEIFSEDVPATELSGTYTVILNPVRDIRVHFREVMMSAEGWDYAEDSGEDQWVSCDACPRFSCGIEGGAFIRSASINHGVSGNAFVEFKRDSVRLPVTNLDVDAMGDECMDTDECEFCYEHVEDMETASPQMRGWIWGNCSDCWEACPFPLDNGPSVDYIPSGYDYAVEGNMYSSSDGMPSGGFSYGFTLERDVEDIYVFIPRRASDRQYAIDEAERDCLTSAMRDFGIEPVSTEDHAVPGAVLMDCTCELLRKEAVSCGVDTGYISSAFWECPVGGGSGPCGGDTEPACTWCCDPDGVINKIERSCQTRVICQE